MSPDREPARNADLVVTIPRLEVAPRRGMTVANLLILIVPIAAYCAAYSQVVRPKHYDERRINPGVVAFELVLLAASGLAIATYRKASVRSAAIQLTTTALLVQGLAAACQMFAIFPFMVGALILLGIAGFHAVRSGAAEGFARSRGRDTLLESIAWGVVNLAVHCAWIGISLCCGWLSWIIYDVFFVIHAVS